MKKILLLLCALLTLGGSGAWAETVTWTSGVSFYDGTTTGNFSSGWFTVVSPFSGTISSFTLNLGTNSSTTAGARNDSYLAISRDLKATTTGLTASDFVAISTNTCGMDGSEITMTFNNAELSGGVKYYFYFVAEENGTYTLKNQRYYVVSSTLMSLGTVNHTTADYTNYAIPFTSTMTLNSGKYYRMKGIKPTNLTDVYIISNSENADKLWKTEDAPSITNANFIWQATIDDGVILQNIGSSRYISKISGSSNGSNVNYLSATTVDDAEKFTLADRSSFANSKAGYVTLKSTTAASDTWLNCYTNKNWYVGSHNASPENGDPFFFIQVKKVTFSKAVAVNNGDAVSNIYLAVDGSESFTLPSSYLYSIDGATAVTNTEAAATIAAAGTDDIIVTVSDNPTRNVTYTLNWSDGTQLSQVADVTANLNANASEFLPSAMANDFVTLNYSPETITSETSEVVVTATWNGPFQLSTNIANAYWYTVGIQSSYESGNYIWKYDEDKLKAESVATDAYYSLSDANCFAFFGNPYNGITIYNKSAGKYVVKTDDDTQATFDATGTSFIPKASTVSGKTIASGYSCFLVSGGTYYLNCYANDSYKVNGWSAADAGSTCWFLSAGQYYLNYIDGLALEAPVGAVGTSSYFTTVANAASAKSALTSLRSTIAGALYSDMATLATVNNQLDPVRAAGTINLTDGYCQIVSAYSDFVEKTGTRRRMIYNGSAIGWTNDMDANNINAIFKLTATGTTNAYSIYSGNGQNYLSNGGGVLGASTAVTFTEAASGTAQYSLYLAEGYNNDHHYLHTLNHQNGIGTSGDLTAWNSGANTASAWYIVPVSSITINLTEIDGTYYATTYLPFDVTLQGDDVKAYAITVNGNWAIPTEIGANIPAGTAVLLKGSAASVTANITSGLSPIGEGVNVLEGTYVSSTSLNGNYVLNNHAEDGLGFYKLNGTLAANRAYLPESLGAEVKGFSLNWDALADGISSVSKAATRKTEIFNLAGQRMSRVQKGVNIVNGKKVLVK